MVADSLLVIECVNDLALAKCPRDVKLDSNLQK